MVRVSCWLLSIVLAMVSLSGCSSPFYESFNAAGSRLSSDRMNELRKEYPLSTGVPATINMREVSFREIMSYGDGVVVAEVMNVLPSFRVELTTEPGTPERKMADKDRANGITPYQSEFISYQVKVHEVVTGADVPKDTFLFYNADFAGVEPELKPGMKIIAVVKKGTTGEQLGGYSFTRYGTYYIVDGDYVLAAYEGESEELRDFTEKTNGIQLDFFMDKIKNLPSG
ncbi:MULTISPECIES: hypothetical protein [Paenibacillus]|uniref:hypothetical protein n=1 Tax=Paenibacillus TaxID=44249 RepID=UPI000F52E6A5|nr:MULTISPECIES: hypothetical protein [Paenibacillus]KAA8753487.1 hypothetical protein FE296_13370 [Paenibacillus sp. UASWS1643]RPK26321.1 hypothetical protein EDO6_04876 [Paenibacillus xylanexedens]